MVDRDAAIGELAGAMEACIAQKLENVTGEPTDDELTAAAKACKAKSQKAFQAAGGDLPGLNPPQICQNCNFKHDKSWCQVPLKASLGR